MRKLILFLSFFFCATIFNNIQAFALGNDPTMLASNDSAKLSKQPEMRVIKPVKLAGPRVGFTTITAGESATFLKEELGMSPTFTQFGWQFEKSYFNLDNGTAGLVEFVGLIGGLEQNKFLPSASVLVGVRNGKGFEFGFGPNLSLSGAAFVLAVGHTIRNGDLNFPLNLAVVPSNKGVRVSLLFGFTSQKD